MEFFLVGLGGALGSIARYLFGLLIKNGIFATFVVNIIGSLLIGVLFKLNMDNTLQKLLIVGFCGGFTTFSTFALQNYNLFSSANFLHLLLYVLVSVVVSVICVFAGILFAKNFL